MNEREIAELLHSIEWNIVDATEALHCAIDLRDWDGVRKYAGQIQDLDRRKYNAVRLPIKTNANA